MAGIKTTEEKVTENVTSDTTTVSSGGLTVNIGKNYDNFNNTIADVQNMSMFAQRGHEAFMINKKTHSSIAIRQNGQINLAADFYAQYKINPGGKITEQSLESTVITNRRSIIADDVLINEHKLNPYLYELTNMKKLESPYNEKIIAGNLCMAGSVLVKAWESDLHRYVLIRRPVRLPVFSPILNVPEINEGLGITDPLKVDEQILAKSTKGYHGNVAQKDANSIIGKEGFNRDGIDNGALVNIGDNTTNTEQANVANYSANADNLKGNDNAEKIWNYLMEEGFTKEAAAGVMGNLMRESGCDPTLWQYGSGMSGPMTAPYGNDNVGFGIAQWTYHTRQQELIDWAKKMGKSTDDLTVQLSFMKYEAQEGYNKLWDRVKVIHDISTAVRMWESEYEGSAETGGPLQERNKFAQDVYAAYANKKS